MWSYPDMVFRLWRLPYVWLSTESMVGSISFAAFQQTVITNTLSIFWQCYDLSRPFPWGDALEQ